VRKPFTIEQLVDCVEALLAGRGRDES